ncbi:MAG: hypothetical protein ACOYK9_01215 [Chlamydiia bacterium]
MSTIQHNPESLRQIFLGPRIPDEIDRVCLPYSCGSAPSYIPKYLLDPAKAVRLPVEEIVTKPLVTVELLKNLAPDLQNHTENRIQLFIQQMFLVYKTKIRFDLYTQANLQVGQVPSKVRGVSTYVGAHSATLPTLRLDHSEIDDTSVSFARDTSLYHGWNTTIYLPEVVNQVDSAIDKSTHCGGSFRKIATDILNKISFGELTPKEGLDQFLITLIQVLDSVKADTRERTFILGEYKKIARQYYHHANNDRFFQKLFIHSEDELVDEPFYMAVQAELHNQLTEELDDLRPQDVDVPALPATTDLTPIRNIIIDKISSATSGDTAKKYIQLAAQAQAVHAAAIKYFIHLQTLSPEKINKDLDRILKIKTKGRVGTIELSKAALHLHTTVIAALKTQSGGKNGPSNMPYILLSLLDSFSRGFSRIEEPDSK